MLLPSLSFTSFLLNHHTCGMQDNYSVCNVDVLDWTGCTISTCVIVDSLPSRRQHPSLPCCAGATSQSLHCEVCDTCPNHHTQSRAGRKSLVLQNGRKHQVAASAKPSTQIIRKPRCRCKCKCKGSSSTGFILPANHPPNPLAALTPD